MRIALNYDEHTGQITSDTGMYIALFNGLMDHEITEGVASLDVNHLCDLKATGFDTEEIIRLNKEGLI